MAFDDKKLIWLKTLFACFAAYQGPIASYHGARRMLNGARRIKGTTDSATSSDFKANSASLQTSPSIESTGVEISDLIGEELHPAPATATACGAIGDDRAEFDVNGSTHVLQEQ